MLEAGIHLLILLKHTAPGCGGGVFIPTQGSQKSKKGSPNLCASLHPADRQVEFMVAETLGARVGEGGRGGITTEVVGLGLQIVVCECTRG
jgi:hypothetical protein